MATIANMTMEELKQLILDLMEEHLYGKLASEESDLNILDESDNRSLVEVFASVEQNRWTPPTGSPTPTQMLREDRDKH